MTEQEHIAALIRSNDELRGALIVAGREMGKRKILGERQRKVLELTRQSVREGGAVVKAAKGGGPERRLAATAE